MSNDVVSQLSNEFIKQMHDRGMSSEQTEQFIHSLSRNNENYVGKQSNSDLFDNPMVNAAMEALSDEDKQRYKEIGEMLYGTINYPGSEIINKAGPPMDEAVAYLKTQLNSGLHPSDMSENEQQIMHDMLGKTWYTQWGYEESDLKEIA